MLFRQLFDKESSTYTYLLADEESREAVILDPVLEQHERDLGLIRALDLKLLWTLETHIHADHVTGAARMKAATGCKTGASVGSGCNAYDHLYADGEEITFGSRHLKVLATPGHTSTCVTFVTDNRHRAFTGDTLFVRGCGRTDFQSGDADTLYRSVHEKIFALPDDCLLFPGHDYKGHTVTTVAEEKAHNPRLGGGKSAADFREIMDNLNLSYPKKIDVALPANMRAGAEE